MPAISTPRQPGRFPIARVLAQYPEDVVNGTTKRTQVRRGRIEGVATTILDVFAAAEEGERTGSNLHVTAAGATFCKNLAAEKLAGLQCLPSGPTRPARCF